MGHHHSSLNSGNHTCPTHSLTEHAEENVFGSMSFFTFDKILGGACAALASLVVLIHMAHHANRLSNPSEQVKIMKVCMLIPFYALFSFLSIAFPKGKVYFAPWLDYFQGIALGAFFLLMSEFISPSAERRDIFLAAMTIQDKKKGSVDGLSWFRKRWIMIFQYPVVALFVAVMTDITQAANVYCQFESKVYFAKLWLTLIRMASLAFAVMSILAFVLKMKTHLAEHKPMLKLVAFKAIVFLGFVQTIIFWILTDTNSLNGTSKLTYADLNMGIPSLLTCIEIVPIAFFLIYAYPVRPYLLGRTGAVDMESGRKNYQSSYQGGFLGIRAFLAILNPRELIEAIGFAFTMATDGHGGASQPLNDGRHQNNGYYRSSDDRYQMDDRYQRDERYPMGRR